MKIEDSKHFNTIQLLSESKCALESLDISGESWFSLIENGDLETALKQIETDYDPATASIPRKLWWLRCQLTLGQVPSSALTSPLEDIFETLKASKEYTSLGCSTFLQSSLKLLEKKQMRLSVLMFDRAAELSKTHALYSLEQQAAIQHFYCELLEQELICSKERRESKDYIKLTEKKIETQKQFIKDLPSKNTSSKNTSSKEIPSVAPSSSSKKGNLNSKALLAKAEQKQSQAKDSANYSENKSETKKLKTIIGVLAFLFLSSLALFSWKTVFSNNDRITSIDEPEISISTETKPTSPELSLNETTEEIPLETTSTTDSNIDAINERIESLSRENSGQITDAIDDIDNVALEQSNNTNLPVQVEREDEIVSIGSEIDAEPIPKATINTNIKSPVTVGSSGRKAPLLNPNGTRVQPKLPNAPLRNRDPLASRRGEKALDGTPLKSYEVENFDPPLTYKTITPTEVLLAPSLLAKSLARLDTGTHIHVTRKMGRWLKLQSKGGKVGFIYAQDAAPAFSH